MKICKECGKEFKPQNTMQKVCGVSCSISFAKKKSRKEFKQETRVRRKKFQSKSRPYLLKKAQKTFNAFIRERDKFLPCISCGRYHAGQYHAGHYKSVGAHPELRFDEKNNNKQCQPCNLHKSGNIMEYRVNLIEKIGQEAVDELEGHHEVRKYTLDEIKEIDCKYKKKLSDLKKLDKEKLLGIIGS